MALGHLLPRVNTSKRSKRCVPNSDETKAALDDQLQEMRKQSSSLKPEFTVHANIEHRLQRAGLKGGEDRQPGLGAARCTTGGGSGE
eukprot:2567605-Pyramimonas_sp.AAC.1